ncbi:monocarboxylate transporter 10-like [Hydractinia symbiolongicarpus]|uniref:monocarboxylate transporter 10-like n=1 Tax=Hydractinia symbiolongicarpus TaxID=13093 RepID=UPI00254FFB6D|nr:monocarboxylate transporter 10-like [Hydractinia symbiolongicarpus]
MNNSRIIKGSHSSDSGRCWVMLFCSSVILFLVFGVHYTFGVLYPCLLREFKQEESKTASVGSLSSGLLFLSSFAAIKTCEWTSVTTTCIIGSLLSGAGLILTSIVKEFVFLYFVYGVLFGVGSSFLYTPCFVMITKWFCKYQTVATGIAAASDTLGGVVLSPVIDYVIQTNGLRETIKSAGIFYLIVTLLCSLSYKFLDDKNVERYDSEQDSVLLKRCKLSEEKKKNVLQTNFQLCRNRRFLMFLLVMMVTNFTYYIPVIHLVNYAEHLGISSTSSSYLISIWSISSICGRLLYGKFISYHRKCILWVYQVSMCFSGIVSLAAYFFTNFWMLAGYVVIYGLLDGSFIGLLSLFTLKIVGLQNFAQGYGIMLTIIGLPIALGPPIIGFINDHKLCPPASMFLFSGLPFVFGSILMLFVIKWQKEESVVHDKHKKSNETVCFVSAV